MEENREMEIQKQQQEQQQPQQSGQGPPDRPKPPLYKRWWFWLILVAALAAVGVLAWVATRPGVEVTPTLADDAGVSPLSAFRVVIPDLKEDEDPASLIAAQPDFAWDLQEEDGGAAFLLTPLKPLDAGTELTLTVRDVSFPFTVKRELLVLSTFPQDGAVLVPVHTGVEFTFNSREIAMPAFEEAFSIQPDAPGQFSYANGRFIFYPEEPLSYGQEYTVTLADTLTAGDGSTLAEPVSFRFTTASMEDESAANMFQLSGTDFSVNALTGESPIVQIYLEEGLATQGVDVAVTLRAFPDADAYKSAMQKSLDLIRDTYYFQNQIDVTGLTETATFSVTPVPAQSKGDNHHTGLHILPFPETIPAGWYAADFTLDINGKPATRQLYLQVSDTAVFYMLLGDSLLAWINDAATGDPVADANVEVQGAYRGGAVTGEDGVALVDGIASPPVGEETRNSVVTVSGPGGRVFVDASVDSFYGSSASETRGRDFVSYLFTDRTVYKTTDTVRVWGVIRPRDGDTPLPDLHLSLEDGAVEVPISPSPTGTFTAELPIESMAPSSWASLAIMAGEDTLRTSSVQITDYVKPVYTAQTAPEKPVYLLDGGDPGIAITLDVSTFDGTPAANFSVNLNTWSEHLVPQGGDGIAQTTDDAGHIRTPLTLAEDFDGWYPCSYQYQYFSEDALSENFYMQGEVLVIHRDLMLRGKPSFTSDSATVDVTANRMNPDAITADGRWKLDDLKGEPLDQEITAEIHKVWYERQVVGTHYDFILRQMVETFDYQHHDDIVDTRTFSTLGGAYTLEDLPLAGTDDCYYLVLSGRDSLGRITRSTVWLGPEIYRYGGRGEGTHRYELLLDSGDPGPYDERQNGIFFTSSYLNFQDGEDVTLVLSDNDVPVESMDGRMLYTIVQEGFQDVTVTGDRAVTIPFEERLVPNYVVTGAYFDGSHIFALENTAMRFNPAKRELEVDIAPAKASYTPGETLDVAVTVSDKTTGAPVEGAEVVLSVVDEAVFALREQPIDILQTIYESIYYPYPYKYTSYLQFDFASGDEKGGGGGGDMRKDFKDTASFQTGTTGSDGRVSFSQTLPDDITSWRLTSLSLTEEGKAGSSKDNVVSTKDFFLTPVVSETLLAGDDCAIGLHGAGVAVAAEDPVEYKARVQGTGFDETLEITSPLRTYASLSFGKLEQGDYTLTLEGVCGDFTDGVQLPFSVVSSGIEIARVETFDLREGINLDSLRYPVNLVLYGQGGRAWNRVLATLSRHSYGPRADMAIARTYLATTMEKRGGYWYHSADLTLNLGGQSTDSLLRPFSYASPDVEFTVKSHLAAPDWVPAGALEGLSISDAEEWYTGTRSAIYLARILAGEQVDQNLHTTLETGLGLDFVDKMYIAMAIAASGDTEGASRWFESLVAPHLTEVIGTAGDALFVDLADGDRDSMACTAAASMLATMLRDDRAQGLVLYLCDKSSPKEAYILEQLYYLTVFSPGADNSAFTWTKDGQQQTVTLDDGPVYLTLNREQLQSAAFAVPSGEVYADVYYTGTPDNAAPADRKRIGLTKTVEPVDGELKAGSLVKVTLTPDFSALDTEIGGGTFLIDDYIPTGMRYEGYRYEHYEDMRGWYLASRQGQRLQFAVYGVGRGWSATPIVYFARCATPGEYVVESAYISGSDSDLWGTSTRSVVDIP